MLVRKQSGIWHLVPKLDSLGEDAKVYTAHIFAGYVLSYDWTFFELPTVQFDYNWISKSNAGA